MFARLVAVGGTTAIVVGFAAAPAFADAAITAVNPGSAVTGTTVAITGSGFSAPSGVTFNGVASPSATLAPSGSEIDAVVPPAATSGPVVVSFQDGTSTSGPSFTVLPTLTLAASTADVTYPSAVTFTATLTSGGAGVAGQPVTLQSHPTDSSAWTNGPTVNTDGNGNAVFSVKPPATSVYQAVYSGGPAYGGATSGSVNVTQHPAVTWRLPSTEPILTKAAVKGSVRPAQTGQVSLEQNTKGRWHTVAHADLTKYGNYSFTIKLPTKGTYTYRVRRAADVHQAGNTSPTMKVLGVDRTLRQGMSGADVKALQKRLVALHYDLGKVSGSFDFDTFHAVVAFQKIQHMTRDGVVGVKAWKALANPRTPKLKHALKGVAAVEVDLTHQVVLYAVNAKIVRILDSSTGGGYYYTGSDGTTQRAVTPTGHFSVKYKVNRWVKSKLGVLYRPAYFNYDGYAIHGEPEVPSYPASHGCVRITVPAMDRMYSKFVTGMSVWIYR